MSQLTSKNLPEVNNEEIINDLTKNLESLLVTSDDTESPTSSVEDSGGSIPNSASHPDFETDYKKPPDKTGFDPEDFDAKEKEDQSDQSDSEDQDELALKDLEVTLTDLEKIERKVQAEKHKIEGNDRFKLAEFETSVDCYTTGLRVCPLAYANDRAVMYSNRAAAKMKLDKNKDAIKDCTKAIENDNLYIKAYYR